MTTSTATVADLIACRGQLSAKDQEFASSMIRQHSQRGYLSEKQMFWVGKLVERATKPAASTPEMATVGNLASVFALFATAREHLKFPAIVLNVPGVGDVRINVAGARARVPGSLNVVEMTGRTWYGRVHSDGQFEKAMRNEPPAAVTETLQRFAADPAGVAAEHGHLTGRCCFCGLALTDERSTAVGYGPICAQHWHLPWGRKEQVGVLRALASAA